MSYLCQALPIHESLLPSLCRAWFITWTILRKGRKTGEMIWIYSRFLWHTFSYHVLFHITYGSVDYVRIRKPALAIATNSFLLGSQFWVNIFHLSHIFSKALRTPVVNLYLTHAFQSSITSLVIWKSFSWFTLTSPCRSHHIYISRGSCPLEH